MTLRVRLISRLLAVFLAVVSITAAAQTRNDSTCNRFGIRPYDRPIDPDSYLIRPGERLEVVFVNTKLPDLSFEVNAEGRIVDRSLGVVDLTGLTLRRARESLLPALQRLYHADQIEISIGSVYPVAIRVSGLVKNPGVYMGYTSQTVREIIDSAGGLAPGGSARRIVFSGGPHPLAVDLQRSLYRDEVAFDPCLYAGARVEVPAQGDVAIVSGEAFGPSTVELLGNDSLAQLVELAGGHLADLDLNGAQAVSDPSRPLTVPGQVRAGDRIWVPAKGRVHGEKGEVMVFGGVKAEGHYPLGTGWTLQTLIDAAGGLTSTADSERIAVFRLARLYDSGQRGRYPLWANDGGAKSLALEHMDSVYVPLRVGHVQIRGQVNRPGFFPYAAGRKVVEYVRMAGGFAQKAERRQVRVLDRVSGLTRLVAPDDLVLDGDVITVLETEEQP